MISHSKTLRGHARLLDEIQPCSRISLGKVQVGRLTPAREGFHAGEYTRSESEWKFRSKLLDGREMHRRGIALDRRIEIAITEEDIFSRLMFRTFSTFASTK
jgi:hypothetical protein